MPEAEDKSNDSKLEGEENPASDKFILNEGTVTEHKKIFIERTPVRLEGPIIERFEDGTKKQVLK